MIKSDLHTHTIYCDGKNTPEEMVLSAIEKGLDEIGIATHSYFTNEIDSSWCIKKEKVKEFQTEVNALKIKYRDKIRVLCGLEKDIFSDQSTDGFDYIIGSVHYFLADGKYYSIDLTPEYFDEVVKTVFNGDYYLATENYFELVAEVLEKTNADIIGHFDLVNKFNANGVRFDESAPRYKKAYEKALYRLLKYKKPFELNTGAISRGYQNKPYPNADMIKIIKDNGGKIILSSDSHSKDNIAFEFEKWEKLL